jgi:SAM-dependent methyltransferase
MEFRKVEAKSQHEITAEWDALAPIRYQQIMSQQDLTFWRMLVPNVLSMLPLTKADNIIDAGCGVGVFTAILKSISKNVIGIDPSEKSIELARHFSGPQFITSTLEDYATRSIPTASVVVANMVLMDVIDLRAFLKAAFAVLRPNGALIFTLTHPYFWPDYYGYSNAPWFHYEQEAIVVSPFRISAQQDCPLNSTHIHRPLEFYMNSFFEAGFVTELLQEPMPSPDIARMYSTPWRFPRYLVGLARREPSAGVSRSRRDRARTKGRSYEFKFVMK